MDQLKEMREWILEADKHFMIAKAPGPSEVYSDMILAKGDVGIRVLIELYQRILDGKGMPADWTCNSYFFWKMGYHEQRHA